MTATFPSPVARYSEYAITLNRGAGRDCYIAVDKHAIQSSPLWPEKSGFLPQEFPVGSTAGHFRYHTENLNRAVEWSENSMAGGRAPFAANFFVAALKL